jgi:hypothetical protein
LPTKGSQLLPFRDGPLEELLPIGELDESERDVRIPPEKVLSAPAALRPPSLAWENGEARS